MSSLNPSLEKSVSIGPLSNTVESASNRETGGCMGANSDCVGYVSDSIFCRLDDGDDDNDDGYSDKGKEKNRATTCRVAEHIHIDLYVQTYVAGQNSSGRCNKNKTIQLITDFIYMCIFKPSRLSSIAWISFALLLRFQRN